MKRIIGLFACLLAFLCIHAETAYTVESIPNPITANRNAFVSNPDRILTAETENYLNQKLNALEQSTTAEVAVVAVKSIGENDINEFAVNLFAKWGIGKKGKDNGLLILLVLDQRKIKFETGYGLEGVLPDAICKRIQEEAMIPFMKNNDFDKGMIAGIDKTYLVLTDKNAAAEIRADRKPQSIFPSFKNILIGYLVISLLAFIIALFSTISTSKEISNLDNYNKYKQTTTLFDFLKIGSIFLPIGLVIFFLIWKFRRNKFRTTPIDCPKCGLKMKRLSRKEEDPFLTPQEIVEENVHSIDYDVWVCSECNNQEILAYDEAFTKYDHCPKCHAKTYSQVDNRIVAEPTTFSSGTGEKVYLCEFCHYEHAEPYEIPRIIIVSGGGRGGGGGFGGGSFGGGSSGGGGSTSSF